MTDFNGNQPLVICADGKSRTDASSPFADCRYYRVYRFYPVIYISGPYPFMPCGFTQEPDIIKKEAGDEVQERV